MSDITEKIIQAANNVPIVYQTGYSDSENDFWEQFQQGGSRTNYEYGFSNWGQEYIRPKYKVVLSGGTKQGERLVSMFDGCSNLKIIEKEYFDFSQHNYSPTGSVTSTFGNYAIFRYCESLEEIQDIGLNANFIYYLTFAYCSKLKKIEKIRVTETTTFSGVFNYSEAIEDITIEGTIGQNGFNISWSPNLTKESIVSIVSALSETLTETKTITLSKTAVYNHFSDDGKNLNSEWSELIKNKTKWSIAFA